MKSIDLSSLDVGLDDNRKKAETPIGPTEVSPAQPSSPPLSDPNQTLDSPQQYEHIPSIGVGLSIFDKTNPLADVVQDTSQKIGSGGQNDYSGNEDTSQSTGFSTTHMSGLVKGGGGPSKDKLKMVGAAVIMIVSFSAMIHSLGSSDDFFTNILEFVGMESNESDDFASLEAPDPIAQQTPPKPKLVRQPKPKPRKQVAQVNVKNPYWPLPNEASIPRVQGQSINSSLEQRWRFGLNHRYPARRYGTVQEIRRERRRGSEYLLFDALEQPKFWTRMEALRALVELGLEVDVDTVEQALGAARPGLITNYFRRLSTDPEVAEFYIMRQAIRIVDAPTRLVILESLARYRGDPNDLYLAAARVDPAPQVISWAQSRLMTQPVPSYRIAEYQKIIDDYKRGQLMPEGVEPEIQELVVEELSDEDIVEEVTFFQDMIDEQEEEILEPEDLKTDGFEDILGDE
ncbi:hypothetical protein [Pseudobacteriovorax antillogorgiicola]|uniref:HEAT repeat-containing protein n=1 Tax=Pseudobacteriovorax antillogorgiicola TaxID=1513793 RepID=A0A1Y6BBC9_9BACT|nr:hypothetical protein [Pseudobacteriovorax antillogorgiicola]TCS58699.1 hypothetical protein EDD56_102212 [Pseudobacteriovorax antillogorgiicola]SME95656.1 hypothetical protein SAMN06296036_102231 [Pseudobacteriovorax antillogorgiicola]